jgi:hypothetical protein
VSGGGIKGGSIRRRVREGGGGIGSRDRVMRRLLGGRVFKTSFEDVEGINWKFDDIKMNTILTVLER